MNLLALILAVATATSAPHMHSMKSNAMHTNATHTNAMHTNAMHGTMHGHMTHATMMHSTHRMMGSPSPRPSGR